MQTKTPSLRQIAAELEISPAYLSYMVNGKRPWRKDLYQRYVGVVSIFVNEEATMVAKEITVDGKVYVLKAPATPPAPKLKVGDFVQVANVPRTSGPQPDEMGKVTYAGTNGFVDVRFGSVKHSWSFSPTGDPTLTMNPATHLLTKIS